MTYSARAKLLGRLPLRGHVLVIATYAIFCYYNRRWPFSGNKLRKFRNKLAHEMVKCIFEDLGEYQQHYNDLVVLRRKIEMWWILNVELPTNPDFDDVEVIESEIVPPSDMMNRFLLDILTGDKEPSEQYYKEMKNMMACVHIVRRRNHD